jgi:hypothetical protein
VILQDADIAKAPYMATGLDINKNPLALNLWNNDYIAQNGTTNQEGGKYQDVWINYLQQTKDPRLAVISIVYNNGKPDTTSSIQQGMPASLNAKPANFGNLSEPNPKTLLLLNSPFLVFTAAESYFLLSEAALRGWYGGTSAASLYQNGTAAAMRQWSLISLGASDGVITAAQINAYLSQNALNTSGTMDQQLNQIYTQFWVSIFPDAEEVFCSYRRTGYPVLVPNNYPGNATNGQIFRRFLYPVSEQNLNTTSYNAAIARQGPDLITTHIWWDKP